MKASLILATYEMPRHLDLVAAALLRQSTRDFEVVIADDGSGPDTLRSIQRFQSQAPFKVQSVRQEHQGFRKCRILNQALRKTSGQTLVFLDGDCVPHIHFMRDHIDQQEPGRYLAGRRMELGPKVSAWLTPEAISRGFFDSVHPRLLQSVLGGETEHFNRSFRVTSQRLRKLLKMEQVDDLKGCNYSVSRDVLVHQLNGFDEAYEGYGREDTDVEIRLQNAGLKIKSLKGLALQYHVWHPRREFTPANETLLDRARTQKRIRCEMGLVRAPSFP